MKQCHLHTHTCLSETVKPFPSPPIHPIPLPSITTCLLHRSTKASRRFSNAFSFHRSFTFIDTSLSSLNPQQRLFPPCTQSIEMKILLLASLHPSSKTAFFSLRRQLHRQRLSAGASDYIYLGQDRSSSGNQLTSNLWGISRNEVARNDWSTTLVEVEYDCTRRFNGLLL